MADDKLSSMSTQEDGNTAGHTYDVDNLVFITKYSKDYKLYSLQPLESKSSELSHNRCPFILHTTSETTIPQPLTDRYLLTSLPKHLSLEYRIHLLISGLSGTGQGPVFFDHVLKPLLDAAGLEKSRYTVTTTEGPESVLKLAREELLPNADKGLKQTVIVLSGDGGVVDILNGIMGGKERSRYSSF